MAKTAEKLELINSLRESLSEKEIQYKEVSDKLLQTEHTVRVLTPFFVLLLFVTVEYSSIVNFVVYFFLLQLENVSKKCSSSDKQCTELKTEVVDITQKLNVLKEKV